MVTLYIMKHLLTNLRTDLEVDARRVEGAPGRPHPVYLLDSRVRCLIHGPVTILIRFSQFSSVETLSKAKHFSYLGSDVDDVALDPGEEGVVARLPRAPLGTVVVLPEVALEEMELIRSDKIRKSISNIGNE